ncbi:TonB family protein [Inquilinus sp. KBS0705]|nr:TonB family protein [Inquilinus sp. KBS0705]
MRLFFILFFLFCSSLSFAQLQNVKFFKYADYPVASADSADYISIISLPDSGSVLYNVAEYYKSGKPKLIGKSKRFDYVQLQGTCVSFFENGHRSAIANYNNGEQEGDCYEYFPNGKTYMHKEYTEKPKTSLLNNSFDYTIREAYDSLGVVTVENGNGILTLYNALRTEATEQGPVINSQRDGDWSGTISDRGIVFKETYDHGVLLTGTATSHGETITYTKTRTVAPQFPNGENAFGRFLAKNIHYPSQDREQHIQGRVILTFFVEKDGTITGIKVIRSVSPGLDSESIKILSMSPKWVPGKEFGFPARVQYSIPVNYALAEE